MAQMSEMDRYVKSTSLIWWLPSVAMKSCSVEAISVSYRGLKQWLQLGCLFQVLQGGMFGSHYGRSPSFNDMMEEWLEMDLKEL